MMAVPEVLAAAVMVLAEAEAEAAAPPAPPVTHEPPTSSAVDVVAGGVGPSGTAVSDGEAELFMRLLTALFSALAPDECQAILARVRAFQLALLAKLCLCAVRSATQAGWTPRAVQASPHKPALNVMVRCSFQPSAAAAARASRRSPPQTRPSYAVCLCLAASLFRYKKNIYKESPGNRRRANMALASAQTGHHAHYTYFTLSLPPPHARLVCVISTR